MPIIDDREGNRRYADMTDFSVNGEQIFRFDPSTGVLEVSASEEVISAMVTALGGLPAAEVVLPAPLPFGPPCIFHNVNEIRSLPRKDRTFFLNIREG